MPGGVREFVQSRAAFLGCVLESHGGRNLNEIVIGAVKRSVASDLQGNVAVLHDDLGCFVAAPRACLDGRWTIWRWAVHLREMEYRIMLEEADFLGRFVVVPVFDGIAFGEKDRCAFFSSPDLPALFLGLVVGTKPRIAGLEGQRMKAQNPDIHSVIIGPGDWVDWCLRPLAFLGVPWTRPRLYTQLELLDGYVRKLLHGVAVVSHLWFCGCPSHCITTQACFVVCAS